MIARRSTERLAIAVGALAEVPAPKALGVFRGHAPPECADLHYLQMFAFCSGTKTLKVNSADRTDREGVTIRGGSDVFNEIASAGLTPSAAANSMR